MSHGWMNWGNPPGTWVGGVVLVVVLAFAVMGIVALIKALFGKGREDITVLEFLNEQYAAGEITKEAFNAALEKLEHTLGRADSALDILKKRYARGDLSLEEFDTMKAHLLAP